MGRGPRPTLTRISQNKSYCVTWDSHSEKRSNSVFIQLIIKVSHNPGTPCLGTGPRQTAAPGVRTLVTDAPVSPNPEQPGTNSQGRGRTHAGFCEMERHSARKRDSPP